MSRTARQARNSPKRIDPCSPRSACSSRTTSAKLGTPARRRQRPKPRHQLAEHRLTHPRPSHTRRAQSSEIQCRSSAVSSPRQRDRHITVHCRSNVPHDPARSVASSVTAVQAHPSRINAPSEDGAPNLTSVQTLRTHEASKGTSRFGRRNGRYVAAAPWIHLRKPEGWPRPR
jgi:hypothetical protein